MLALSSFFFFFNWSDFRGWPEVSLWPAYHPWSRDPCRFTERHLWNCWNGTVCLAKEYWERKESRRVERRWVWFIGPIKEWTVSPGGSWGVSTDLSQQCPGLSSQARLRKWEFCLSISILSPWGRVCHLEWTRQPENLSAPHVSITLYRAGLLAYAPTPGFYKGAEDLNMCPYAWAVSDLTLWAISLGLKIVVFKKLILNSQLTICWNKMLSCLFFFKSYLSNTFLKFP